YVRLVCISPSALKRRQSWRNQMGFGDPGRNLGSTSKAKLLANIGEMPLGGRLGDHQLVGNLAVGQATPDELRNFASPCGEWVDSLRTLRYGQHRMFAHHRLG